MIEKREVETGEGDAVALAWAALTDLDGVRAAAHAELGRRERERLESEPDRRADELLLGRHLLRGLVRAADPTGGDTVVIDARCARCGGPHGRPVVSGRPFVASVAHAGGLVVAALAPAAGPREIGVDVEPLSLEVRRVTGDDDVRAWVRYEAAMKANGGGVVGNRGEVGRTELEAHLARLADRCETIDVEIPGYAVAVAVGKSPATGKN